MLSNQTHMYYETNYGNNFMFNQFSFNIKKFLEGFEWQRFNPSKW